MDIAALIQEVGVYGCAFVVCMVSGFFPVVNAELSMVGLVMLAPESNHFLLLVLMGTLGEIAGKCILYWGGRGAFNLSLARYQERMEKWRSRFTASEPGLSFFIFASAVIGIPPFFVIVILAGTFRLPFVRFFAIGLVGRFIRFTLIGLFPKALMEIF
jgi:membrane protein YqaA with SNARE-associated domain